MTLSAILTRLGWPLFQKRQSNLLMSDPAYAALCREEQDLRDRHMNARRPREEKRRLVREALERAVRASRGLEA